MKPSLRDEIDGRISHMSDHIHQDDIDSCITDIFKIFKKRIDELYDKTCYIDSADLLYSDIKDILK
jgi:hypothetical protein